MPRSVTVSPEIVVQAEIGGFTLAFTEKVEHLCEAEVNDRLDLYYKVVGRQRAQFALIEALIDLKARREALVSLPDRERAMVKDRTEERARLRASFEAQHEVSGRRTEFKLNQAQRGGLEQFDANMAMERAKFAEEKKKLEQEIPVYEAQVNRQRSIVNGADRLTVLEGGLEAAE